MSLRCTVRVLTLRLALLMRSARSGRKLSARLMRDELQDSKHVASASDPMAGSPGTPPRHWRLLLIRHGETTYNVEKRLPGRLPDVALTEEGRRQAHRAAIALSAIPLTAVIASPLERARDTAEIIARGWSLPVRLDVRLVDTDVGRWSGRKIDELQDTDPEWKSFVAHPTEPPLGVEGMTAVEERAVAAVEEIRGQARTGDVIAVVAHADVVKLIIGHYVGLHPDCAHRLHTDNASISALEFLDGRPPMLVALNWVASPWWLTFLPKQPDAGAQQSPGGASPKEAVSEARSDQPTPE